MTLDDLRAIVLALPGTVEGTSWDNVSFKVDGKVVVFWHGRLDCPVFKVSFDERDLLLEVDPETFFITDHHRPSPLVLARPGRLDPEWARANVTRVWRAQAKKATVRAWEAEG
jgi:hypothetical protein